MREAWHLMFGPSYEACCPTCSSMADAVDGHLHHRWVRRHDEYGETV